MCQFFDEYCTFQKYVREDVRMKEIIIVGAGGLGREIQWLIERINEDSIKKDGKKTWDIIGYVDDGHPVGMIINGYSILGGIDFLVDYSTPISVVCAIGSSKTRRMIVEKLKRNTKISFPNLFDPTVQVSDRIEWGEGNIVCCMCVLTVNIKIGDFCVLNWDCTVGHDAILESFVTAYPSVNISGMTCLGQGVELGTGTQIIQGKTIGSNSIVGAGSVVVKDIPANCTAVGSPCKPIKYHE